MLSFQEAMKSEVPDKLLLYWSKPTVRPAWHCAAEGGAAQAVWVAGKLMVSVYLAPCFASTTIYQDVSAKILGLPHEQDWLIGGDFNATPQECPFRYSLMSANMPLAAL